MECLKSGLDIFLKRSIQTSVVNSHTVTYKPIAPADNPAQLEFHCSGHSDFYIDLNSVRLLLRIKLVKTDGTDLTGAEPNTVGCVNNLLHSMFSSLSVSLNGKPVSLHETNYHYKAYLEKLLNYGADASGTHLVSSFWFMDSGTENGSLTADKANKGYTTRLNYLSESQTIELYGRLHADLFNSDRMLINGVDMNIRLTRAPEAFYLLGTTDDVKVRIKILDATLFVTQTEIKPPLLLAHANVLAMKRKAHYPITHTQIKTFTAGAGAQQISIDNAFLGPIPERLLIGLVKNTAFVGSVSTNPFQFHHYDMTYLVLYVNGIQYPSESLTMDCSSPFGVTRAYETLFSSTGIHHDDRGHMITMDMFTKGFYILGFDLTVDKEADEEHISLPRQGNVRIEARFKKPLPEPVTCILYAEFPGHVEIDGSRTVTVE
jgi:hypothetical protein